MSYIRLTELSIITPVPCWRAEPLQDFQQMDLDDFLQNPRESLNIELKAWIDPLSPEGKAKIVKAAIALRNLNGGHLGIGISNEGKPLISEVPANLDDVFHQDSIQALITKHSSEAFEISVQFGNFKGARFPFIIIPPGVRTPVAAKLGIVNPISTQKDLVRKDTVYIRTLNSNLTPSSAAAQYSDWPQIMNVCFDNREADIGNFLRRHLSGIDISQLISHLSDAKVEAKATAIEKFINECREKFEVLPKSADSRYLGKGRFEVAFIINSKEKRLEIKPNEHFLASFIYANPHHTGWPFWMDTRSFASPNARPTTSAGGWQAFVEDYEGSFLLPHLDFWRVIPPGSFYHIRAMFDDLIAIKNNVDPDRNFSMDIAIENVAEAISTAISFARSMQYPVDDTTLDFAFRWTGLVGRELGACDHRRYISPGRIAGDDEFVSYFNLPLNIAPSSIPSTVPGIVEGLFSIFHGMAFSDSAVEEIAAERLNRRL